MSYWARFVGLAAVWFHVHAGTSGFGQTVEIVIERTAAVHATGFRSEAVGGVALLRPLRRVRVIELKRSRRRNKFSETAGPEIDSAAWAYLRRRS